jgi:hypothetical protein
MKTDGYRTMTHHVALFGLLPHARAEEGDQKSKKCVMCGMVMEIINDFNDHDHDALVVERTNHERRRRADRGGYPSINENTSNQNRQRQFRMAAMKGI